MMKRTILWVMLAVGVAAWSGCKNTAEGVGKDVEQAGEKIQEKAK